MALGFYNSDQVAYSDLGDLLLTQHNGVTGSSVEVFLYIRNDSVLVTYDTVVIYPRSSAEDTSGPYESFTSDENILGPYGNGRGIQLVAGSRRPTVDEWKSVAFGNTIAMDDVTDTTTYHPFWARITVNGHRSVSYLNDIKLVVGAIENIV